jgi:hypothetical protein
MRHFLRAVIPFIVFWIVALICINSHWRWLDTAILACTLAGFLLLSILGLQRSFKTGRVHLGQTAGLPDSWRRWVFDDQQPPKPIIGRNLKIPPTEKRR